MVSNKAVQPVLDTASMKKIKVWLKDLLEKLNWWLILKTGYNAI